MGKHCIATADRCSAGFEPALADYDRTALACDPATVIGIDPEFRIAYLNRAWDAFAEANGGQPEVEEHWNLGANYLAALPKPVRSFYERLFLSAQELGSLRRPVQHQYECSSPTVYRKFQMNAYGLPDRSGILVAHSLVIEQAHKFHPQAEEASELVGYIDGDGIVKQCCHCRRIERPAEPGRWDWIPQWVEEPPDNTSHSLCNLCLHSYYSELNLAGLAAPRSSASD